VPEFSAVGFTSHALQRFVQRSGLPDRGRDATETLLHGLFAAEGAVRYERPYWAPSRRRADVFLQLGNWMVFPAVATNVGAAGEYLVVTAITSMTHGTWRTAVHAGLIQTAAAVDLLRRFVDGPRTYERRIGS
jgi:hypothetical protein